MRNFKLLLDLSDLQIYLQSYQLSQYKLPFCLHFIEANDPDDACYEIMVRLMKIIISQDQTIETRIICRRIRKLLRIDKIYAL